jgi:hypothetical protein
LLSASEAADVIECSDKGGCGDRTDARQCGEPLHHDVIRNHGGKLIVGARQLVVEHFDDAPLAEWEDAAVGARGQQPVSTARASGTEGWTGPRGSPNWPFAAFVKAFGRISRGQR